MSASSLPSKSFKRSPPPVEKNESKVKVVRFGQSICQNLSIGKEIKICNQIFNILTLLQVKRTTIFYIFR